MELTSSILVFYTSCHTKVKEPSLHHYLPRAGGRIVGSVLSKVYECYGKCKQLHLGFEVGLPCPFSMMTTTTLRDGDFKIIIWLRKSYRNVIIFLKQYVKN